MLNLKNTLDGYLKNVEVIGNTIQDTNNLANIRSVGDKVEGQELYKIDVVSRGKNLFNKDAITHNKTINTTTGIETASNEYHISNFIKINPNTRYIRSLGGGIFYYDKDFNFISMIDQTKNSPLNAMYCRLQLVNTWDLNTFQFEEGTQASPYEPYQGQKLEILSPVQLEKVGDVADRIICKDGVWGVEKNITTTYLTSAERWGENTTDLGFKYFLNKTLLSPDTSDRKIICNTLSVNDSFDQSYLNSYNQILVHKSLAYSNYLYITLDVDSVEDFKKWLDDNPTYIKYETKSQFIALPHDQQVKLRTFAGQTNIAFLTEIPGQIKAQVPKSLGATVNTHTEQIADLHNSLDRVKKLEETTISTVETESSFTTVDATNNGYFEDVKLEGRTLVNRIIKTSWKKYGGNNTLTTNGDVARLERTVADGNVCYMALPLRNKFEVNQEYTIVLPHYTGKLHQASLYDRGNGYAIQVGMVTFTGNVGKLRVRNDKLTFSNNIELLFYIGDTVGDYLEISYNIVILEGDHTNNPPSYFESLMSVGQDVEELSVVSGNSNLFEEEQHIPYGMVNGIMSYNSNNMWRTYYIKCKPNTSYFVRSIRSGNRFGTCYSDSIHFKDVNFPTYDGSVVSFDNSLGEGSRVVTTDSKARYLYIYVSNTGEFQKPTIHVEEASGEINYIEPMRNKKPLLYFNPTTETWEKPVLREWDTIEKHSDGKYYYHKRSEEVVLNGSENWASSADNNTTIRFAFRDMQNIKYSKIIATIPTYMDNDNFIVDKVSFGICSRNNNTGFNFNIEKSKLSTQDVTGFKAWLKANPTTVVYQLAQEEVYECTNIDLMTYSGETNYIINSGAISPKSLLKVHNNISNVVKILQEKVSLLENTFIAGLKSVLSGDMYSLATILYPEDFEQNDNTEQDIMVIPE